jgi:hypothetical protein
MASSMVKEQWKYFKINKVMEKGGQEYTSTMENALGTIFMWPNKFWGLLILKLK